MAIVYLALGSNLGKREQYIKQAIEELKHARVNVLQVSTLIETDPVGGPPQGQFLNGALKAETNLTPQQLLKVTQQIENELGRVRNQMNGPRTIDIDILLYDNLSIETDELVIPHPRMHEREFVMTPLKEIKNDIKKPKD